MRLGRLLELLEPGVGDDGICHPRIGGALGLAHVAGALEPVEEPGDAGSGQHEPLCEVDAAKPVPVGAREVKEHLVVVDRQAVSVHQIGVQCASERRVGAEEADPGIEARPLSEYLIAQYLTTQ